MTRKRTIPPGVRGAIAAARTALSGAAEKDVPVKDQAELVAGAEAWRDQTYQTEGDDECTE